MKDNQWTQVLTVLGGYASVLGMGFVLHLITWIIRHSKQKEAV